MKVAFLDSVHDILAKRLNAAGYTCVHLESVERDDLKSQLGDVEGIVIRSRLPMDESILQFAPNLKFIARSGAGMENIDIVYCETRNITLFNAPEGNRNAVGEHALGMLLSLFNKLHTADRDVKSGKWQRELNRGIELDGKTIAIIGFGNNGSAFAQKLAGFEVKILAYDKYKSGFGTEKVKESSLKEIYRDADVVSFHIPQNEETLFFANKQFFGSFNKPIWLLNLSRGKIVHTQALVEALQSNLVLGAGLDVLEYEKSSFEAFLSQQLPSDFKYLMESDRVILSPHVGGWTEESYYKLSDVLADKIIAQFGEMT